MRRLERHVAVLTSLLVMLLAVWSLNARPRPVVHLADQLCLGVDNTGGGGSICIPAPL